MDRLMNLNQFERFDWEAFAKGKEFLVTGTSEYVDFNTKAHLGTRVNVVISKDETEYHQKSGENRNNKFEKLVFKVAKDVNVPADALVIPKGVVASIYGNYRNQLSIKCEDLEIIKSPNAKERANA